VTFPRCSRRRTYTINLSTPWIGKWVGPTAGLDVLEKILLPLPGIKPRIVQPAAYPLCWLSYPGFFHTRKDYKKIDSLCCNPLSLSVHFSFQRFSRFFQKIPVSTPFPANTTKTKNTASSSLPLLLLALRCTQCTPSHCLLAVRLALCSLREKTTITKERKQLSETLLSDQPGCQASGPSRKTRQSDLLLL
jgi:hypothetical protein